MKCRALFSHGHAVPNTKYFVFCEIKKENPWRMLTFFSTYHVKIIRKYSLILAWSSHKAIERLKIKSTSHTDYFY